MILGVIAVAEDAAVMMRIMAHRRVVAEDAAVMMRIMAHRRAVTVAFRACYKCIY